MAICSFTRVWRSSVWHRVGRRRSLSFGETWWMWKHCHGSWVPGPVLTVSCLYACAYVWAGVCGCVWLRLIRSSWESSPLGYISSCHALPLVRSLQFAVDVYEAFLVPGFPRFLSPAAFLDSDRRRLVCPLLPCATRLSPYGKLRFCLRKAPLLPTESSASAYGSSAPLPTESSV